MRDEYAGIMECMMGLMMEWDKKARYGGVVMGDVGL
jgi:hypothetical protein